MENIVTNDRIGGYCAALVAAEYAQETIAKYRRDIYALAIWLNNRPATQENLTEWKSSLMAKNYAPCTINSMLAAANGFFRHMGWGIKLKFLRIQRRLYRDGARELSRAEYERLLAAARESGKVRLALIMETLCAAGDHRAQGEEGCGEGAIHRAFRGVFHRWRYAQLEKQHLHEQADVEF